jgi:hypothetical protein
MPNVPNLPGVPALSSYLSSVITLLTADAIGLLLGHPQSLWNIFLDGEQAFDFHSIAGFGYKRDWVIATYPTDDGAFFSYDKVQNPFECRLRITSGGTEEERQDLIEAVEDAGNTLNLYDIITPEKIYPNCNVARISLDRTADHGVGMIVIEVSFQEIRSSEASQFSSTQQPGSAGQSGIGNVQPQAATSSSVVERFPIGDVQ